MRWWWVNHKQTFKHEFKGGFIWSPKRNRDGRRNRFYDFMREVRPGDKIFSYAAGIRGIGTVKSHCYTCPRPDEFGHIGEVWDIVGQRIDVAFAPFPKPIRPKDHIRILTPLLLDEPFPPLRLTGDGQQQIYLTPILSKLAEVILGLSGIKQEDRWALAESPPDGTGLVEQSLFAQQEWEDIEQNRITKADIPLTTRVALVQARVGQGLFKERVARLEKACRVTFVNNPVHLIASHIKPWRESTNDERLAGGNGLLLTPSIDRLFDRGFITFEDSGELVVSPVADLSSLRRMGVDPKNPPKPFAFNSDQKHFLDHHRQETFLKTVNR